VPPVRNREWKTGARWCAGVGATLAMSVTLPLANVHAQQGHGSCAQPLAVEGGVQPTAASYKVVVDSPHPSEAVRTLTSEYGLVPTIQHAHDSVFVAKLEPSVVAALRCDQTVRGISLNQQECLGILRPSIIVTVYVYPDTGRGDATDVLAMATDGAFVDTLRPGEWQEQRPISLQGALERSGTYALTLRKRGYRDWHRDDIRVPPGACHVGSAHLSARLMPMPGK
jgi:hypothetical protein